MSKDRASRAAIAALLDRHRVAMARAKLTESSSLIAEAQSFLRAAGKYALQEPIAATCADIYQVVGAIDGVLPMPDETITREQVAQAHHEYMRVILGTTASSPSSRPRSSG